MEPGPCPILMIFAQDLARNSTPTAEVTFPAMIVTSLHLFRTKCTTSQMLWVCACALEIAIASTHFSMSLAI